MRAHGKPARTGQKGETSTWSAKPAAVAQAARQEDSLDEERAPEPPSSAFDRSAGRIIAPSASALPARINLDAVIDRGRSSAAQSVSRAPIAPQAKLSVGAAGDRFEQEADRLAEQVMEGGAAHGVSHAPGDGLVQRACAGCEEDEKIRGKPAGAALAAASPSVTGHVAATRGGGAPLTASARAFFEPRFGYDFGGVRVHDDRAAQRSALELRARAYTVGRDIYFGAREYSPDSDSGRRLIAHELAHVAQQSGAPAVDRAGAGVTRASGETVQRKDNPADLSKLDPNFQTSWENEAIVTAAMATLLDMPDPKANQVARVQRGVTLQLKATSKKPEIRFVAVEYYGHMNAVDNLILAYVATSDVKIAAGPWDAKVQRDSMQLGHPANDWMLNVPDDGVKTADNQDAIDRSVAAIQQERASIKKREKPAMHPVEQDSSKNQPRAGWQFEPQKDPKSKDYLDWLKTAVPALAKGPDDMRWRIFKILFKAEGYPNAVMTYDNTDITWGVGFAGHGPVNVGLTEQMMGRLFNQSAEAKDAFWRAGATVIGNDLVVVDTEHKRKKRGIPADEYYRLQVELLSLMVNVSEGIDTKNTPSAAQTAAAQMPAAQTPAAGQTPAPKTSLRQSVLDAQFETFINSTLADSGGVENEFGDPLAGAYAAHAVHAGKYASLKAFKGAKTVDDVKAKILTHTTNGVNDGQAVWDLISPNISNDDAPAAKKTY